MTRFIRIEMQVIIIFFKWGSILKGPSLFCYNIGWGCCESPVRFTRYLVADIVMTTYMHDPIFKQELPLVLDTVDLEHIS